MSSKFSQYVLNAEGQLAVGVKIGWCKNGMKSNWAQCEKAVFFYETLCPDSFHLLSVTFANGCVIRVSQW